MTDKRSESERVSGRPPMPSIAPPTDDIDAEWGADAIPGPAPLPKVAAEAVSPSTAAPAPRASTPAPRPSSIPAAPIATPIPRPSSAAPTPLVAANNPLRKQTLLGIAPVIPPRSVPPAAEPAKATPSQPPAAASPIASAATPAAAPTPAAENPLRKQTLFGIAPVLPQVPKAEPAPAAEPSPSVSNIVTPAMVATDAPTTTDVPEPPAVAAKPQRSQPARAATALSISHDDLPELKPRPPRWRAPLGVAAVLALGVVGLRQLDHAPTPTPAELAHPVKAAKAGPKAGAKAPSAAAKGDGEGDDDDDPNTGGDSTPDPTPSEPDPLKAKPGDAAAAPAAAAPAAAAPAAAAANAPTAPIGAANAAPALAGATIRINVDSDPPGARLFWKGKEVGTTPFVLELQPGEKHAYELGLSGFTTRKVVIDGSKTDISIGLRPDPTAPIGASNRN